MLVLEYIFQFKVLKRYFKILCINYIGIQIDIDDIVYDLWLNYIVNFMKDIVYQVRLILLVKFLEINYIKGLLLI